MDWLGDYFGWIFSLTDGLTIGELVLAALSVVLGITMVVLVLAAVVAVAVQFGRGVAQGLRSTSLSERGGPPSAPHHPSH